MSKPPPKLRKSRDQNQPHLLPRNHQYQSSTSIVDHEYCKKKNFDHCGTNFSQITHFEVSAPQKEVNLDDEMDWMDGQDLEMNYSVEVQSFCHTCHSFQTEVIKNKKY